MSFFSKRTKEINDFIFKWIDTTVVKYPVILEDQHEPRPRGPYISFKILTQFSKIGLNDEEYFDATLGSMVMRGYRDFTVSINATGQPLEGSKSSLVRATDLLGLLQWSLEKSDVRSEFQSIGLGIIDSMNIIDTTQLEENMFIPSAVLDIRMSAVFSEVITKSFIEHVEITGSVDERTIGPINIDKP